MSEVLVLNFHYFSNFPIKSNYANKNYNFSKPNDFTKYSKKKFCKNFFLILLFLKFFEKKNIKNDTVLLKYNFLTKPNKQNLFNYLRAPYKNKLSRNQLYTPRYKFSIQIKLFKKILNKHKSIYYYINVLNFFIKNISGFQSNIFYLNKVSIKYNSFVTYFLNYKNIIKYKWILKIFFYLRH